MHSLLNTIQSLQQANSPTQKPQNNKIIAENIFKDLKSSGLRDKDIVAVSSELLSRLTLDIQNRSGSEQTTKA